MKVFPYEFEVDGRKLRVIVDREAREIMGLETPELSVECWVEEQEAPAGMVQEARWRVENKGDEEISSPFSCFPDPDIKIVKHPKSSFKVPPKEEVVVSALFEPDVMAEERDKEERSRKIASKLLINGLLVPIAAGVRIKQPVEVSIDLSPISCFPGTKAEVLINLRSFLRKKARASLILSYPEQIEVEAERSCELDPFGFSGSRQG